ncbi:hypothetical protein [Bacillus safensis]|uniref:hypothetical protein n=1 Tax=Bacillus safensis TaxID=561879 RepID=UPI0039823AF7
MWFFMLLSLIATMIYQFSTKGFNGATATILLPTVVSLIKVLYDKSSNFRVCFRWIKNHFNIDNYDIDLTAVFNINDDSTVKSLKADYTQIQTLLYDILKSRGISGAKNHLIEVSFNNFNDVIMYVKPYKIYFSFKETDNGGQVNLTVGASATLKYKNGQEIIEEFIVRIFKKMNNNLCLKENKYTMKVAKNTKKTDFLKKHFIKELNSSDIDSFKIVVKTSPGVHLTVGDEKIVMVTSQISNLVKALDKVIKLIL